MPRLHHSLIRQARAIDHLLPLLLRPCRDLASARNELRWLRQSVSERNGRSARQKIHKLRELCLKRSVGVPLQYLLGTQPFGDLEIICRPKVLIPRLETESYTLHLGRLLTQAATSDLAASSGLKSLSGMRILDVCTGTGCIALLLHSILYSMSTLVRTTGIDVSPYALQLARKNLAHNVERGHISVEASKSILFAHGDVLKEDNVAPEGCDIVVSNPPYISKTSFYKNTERSVRQFEPRLALVPEYGDDTTKDGVDLTGDIFFGAIMAIGEKAGAKLLVMEIEDMAQAQRVLGMAAGGKQLRYWRPYAVWGDDIAWTPDALEDSITYGASDTVPVQGGGKPRAVILVRVSQRQHDQS